MNQTEFRKRKSPKSSLTTTILLKEKKTL